MTSIETLTNFQKSNHLRWTIIADVIEESLSSRSTIRTLRKTTTDFMCCRPNHLSVMTNNFEVIVRRSVSEVHVFQKPSFYCEKPESAHQNRLWADWWSIWPKSNSQLGKEFIIVLFIDTHWRSFSESKCRETHCVVNRLNRTWFIKKI